VWVVFFVTWDEMKKLVWFNISIRGKHRKKIWNIFFLLNNFLLLREQQFSFAAGTLFQQQKKIVSAIKKIIPPFVMV